ncbi:glyoxal oxidase precursor [Salix suchowensis]|nr:glyoxal oxidase precursor [Salix suchowensis]
MRRPYFIPALSLLSTLSWAAPSTPQWRFNLKEATSGIVALESIVVSPTLTIFFNRPSVDPLQFNNHSALGALWDLETSSVAKPSTLASEVILELELPTQATKLFVSSNRAVTHWRGLHPIRKFGNPSSLRAALVASSIRIFDGSLMIVGGTHVTTPFYNVDPDIRLPDGRVFMVANNQSIYTISKPTPKPFSPTYPTTSESPIPSMARRSSSPSLRQTSSPKSSLRRNCDRHHRLRAPIRANTCFIPMLADQAHGGGIKAGWQVEHMLEGRTMPELLHLPNGQILIANGGSTASSGGDARSAVHDAERPKLVSVPKKLAFGQKVSVPISIPRGCERGYQRYANIKRARHIPEDASADGHFTHSFPHGSWVLHACLPCRRPLVFMDATISPGRNRLTFTTPPNGKVYPPGPATIFLTVDDVTSEGAW